KEGWVFVDARWDGPFRALCEAVGCTDLLADDRFTTVAGRSEHRDALGARLQEGFASRTADEWESMLTAAGVGGVRADRTGHRRFLHEDPHTQAIQFMVPTSHWLYEPNAPGGRYWRHGPVARFSETPCAEGLPYAALGEQTRQILEELGYEQDEIDGLKANGVVNWPDRPDRIP